MGNTTPRMAAGTTSRPAGSGTGLRVAPVAKALGAARVPAPIGLLGLANFAPA